jgi:hypothetical protein
VDPGRVRFLIGGLFLVGLALFNFVSYTKANSLQSTFNILSREAYYLTSTVSAGDSIDGAFQEASGSLVSFYVLNSVQFAAFQAGTSLTSIYSIENVASGVIAYAFTAQDTYYLLFRHGSGLMNSTETVSFQRTYTTHDNFRLELGLFFLAVAAVELVVAFRPRKPAPVIPPPPPLSTYLQGQSTATLVGQASTKRCSLCGQVVGEQLNFCPTCGNKLNAVTN